MMTISKTTLTLRKKMLKINCFFLMFVLQILLFSCSKQNQIGELFNKWLLVDKAVAEMNTDAGDGNDSDIVQNQYESFLREFEAFRSTAIYKNLIMSEEYASVLQNLEATIPTGELSKIRIAVFQLAQTDKYLTQKSNQEYSFLAELLIVFSIIICVLLYIIFRRYEKKRNEAKQLGIYSDFMIKGMETERTRISKEIHDTILQDLKVLSLKTELIDSVSSEQNEKIKAEILTHTDLCIKQLRSICNNLTPVEFKNPKKDVNGFILAIQNLTEQYIDKTKSSCVLKLQDNLDISSLNKWQTINLFRIIQEALNNAEKHSQATKVSIIMLNCTGDDGGKLLKIFITDNGKGFDVHLSSKDNSYNNGHFGLSNMKERAKDIGAAIEIFSEAGGGTEIKLEVPLK